MKQSEWIEEEVKIAKAEAEDDGYLSMCIDSAYKAYQSLLEDGHSGYSFGLTSSVLKRMLENKPLTAIKDIPDDWMLTYKSDSLEVYQCKRMSSLFKDIKKDGDKEIVTYSDVDRYRCVDSITGDTCTMGLGRDIIDELYPITMPYYPPVGYFKIFTDERGSSGTSKDEITFLYLITPDGEKVMLNRRFIANGYGWKEVKNE